jgi:amino acid transporter
MLGTTAGHVLIGSRMLFALAERGQLPPLFARVHPRYGTPVHAIVFTSTVAVMLALSGSFAAIAVVSALARLLIYGGTAAATLRLRSHAPAADAKPATFIAPLGPTMPIVAMGVCAVLTAGATRQQLFGGAAALAAGAVLQVFNMRRKAMPAPMA